MTGHLNPDIIDAAQIIWDFHAVNHTVKPCDVMLVLGSHDLQVPDHAAKLYHQNMAPLLVCSGGIAHTDPGDLLVTGWDRSEADVFADTLIQKGVPADKILREPQAKNTGQNFSLTKQLLEEMGYNFQSMLAVTKPYMERRALATADIQLPGKDVIVTAPRQPMLDYLAHSEKGIATEIAIMIGDVQRLIHYPAQGFMSEQPISEQVHQAFEYLVAQGFTGNLMKM